VRHIDLFSGIGGFALACKWVWGDEYENVGHSEIEKFPCQVYHKHFSESRCLGDITKIKWWSVITNTESKQAFTTKPKGLHAEPCLSNIRIDLITGGFPCQPFSVAGKRRGKEDDRFLWHEMLRAIQEVKPRWILAENVSGIESMALDEVLSSLEVEGYTNCEGRTEIIPFVIPACAVNAPHRRDRVWIVAHSTRGRISRQGRIQRSRESERADSSRTSSNTEQPDCGSQYSAHNTTSNELSNTNTNGEYCEKHERGNQFRQERRKGASRRSIYEPVWQESWLEVATRLCRMDDGVRNRVDRLKGLGNAIVPQVAEVILRAIKEMELNK
jgi:DNA (cytosine-5)-methyltransferase 1